MHKMISISGVNKLMSCLGLISRFGGWNENKEDYEMYKKATVLFLLILLFCFRSKSQTLVFYKPTQKREYHFRQNQVLTFYLKDNSKYKGSISSVSQNQIVVETDTKGQVTIENNVLKGFSARHHLWYFGQRWASLIRYNKKRSLEGYKYKLVP